MPLIYSLIARGSVILAEYSASKGNFLSVTRRLLEKLPTDLTETVKKTYVYDRHLFHYVQATGLVFMCMSDEEFGRRIPFAFLEDIQNRFFATYGERGLTAPPYGMNEDFSRVLQNQMNYFSNTANDKINKVKNEVDELKSVMVENIEKVITRSERIEVLMDKTEDLENQALNFRHTSTALKRSLWWKNVKLAILLGFIILLVLYFILAIFCGLALHCGGDSPSPSPSPPPIKPSFHALMN